MRILILNQTFFPDVAATAQYGHDLAQHLVREGHEVVAIASRSMYGKKGAALPATEMHEGIEIHRVGMSLFGRSGTIGRLIDFALWYLAATWKALRVKRCDVCIALTTPPFIALVAVLLRALKGTRFVYWVMDLYPEVPVLYGLLGERSLLTRILERIHRFVLRRASRVIVLGRCMEKRVLDKGIDSKHVEVIRVWADQNEIGADPSSKGTLRDEWGLSDAFVVMYAGNFGMMHDSQTIFEAAARLKDHPRIRFVFVGDGARYDEARAFAEKYALKNMVFHPYQDRARLGELLVTADLHLLSMIDGAEGTIVPSKLFGIMASGKPAVFVGPASSEIGRLIIEEKCGAVMPVGDVDTLAAEIQRLADDPSQAATLGEAGRRALEERYDREPACAAIERVCREVVGMNKAQAKTAGAQEAA